jgi:DNA-binding SARP family transcriptional activator
VEFLILGPLEAREGGQSLRLGGRKQRAVLAFLLLHANEVVSRDRLIHELWGERPPETVQTVLQVYVSRLRKSLRSGNGDGVIVTRAPGYLLRLAPEQLDRERFERLAAEGRRAAASGDAVSASEKLAEALALWRGPALADLTYEPFAQVEIAALEEARLACLEDRLEAELALGRQRELVGELETLVKAHPLRERLRGQLMLALYRAGRQAEALEVYQATRRTLVEELGIEPSRALQELEKAILNQDPSLEPAGVASAPTPVEPHGRPAPRSPFVGRERELAELTTALEDALAGAGRLVLLAGEPGIGKSRLADEVANRAKERGARILVGRCWEAGGAPAYWPWVQALRSYIRETQSDAVRVQLGAGATDVAQILPELREMFPGLPAPPSLEPEAARFRLFDSMATFLGNAATTRPLVIALDDLHAADEPTLLLLRFVTRQLSECRLLLVGAYRDVDPTLTDPLTAALAELAREPVTRTVSLVGLGKGKVAEFVELTSGEPPTQELVATIHQETEGNPLFVGEVVRLLLGEGRLNAAAVAELAIPQSMKEVIGRRLRHLSAECNRLLTLASVLGREFDLDALIRVSELDRDTLLGLLDEAIAGRVVGEVPGSHGRLRFAHVLMRDVLYDELGATQRMRLHRRVGEALEALYAKDPEPHLAELALHAREALPVGDAEKAVQFASRAGDHAATLLAFEEAARLYVVAIEIAELHGVGDEVDRCDLLLRLGDVQARAGDIPSAKEIFLHGAEIARAAGLPEHLARAALGYGGRLVWTRAWGDEHLVPLLEEALAALPDEDSELRVRLLARLAAGPLRDTLAREPREEMAQKAVDMARRLGDPATLAYALEGRCETYWGPDALEQRLAFANELIDVAEIAGEPERAYAGFDLRFHALFQLGDLPAVHRDHEAATRLARELRQPAQLWDTVTRGTQLALFEGRFAEAEPAIHEALDLGRLAQSANAQLAFDLQMYALRREQGRLEEVVDVVDRAVEDYPAYPVWRYVSADVFAELGRKNDAGAALDACAADEFQLYQDAVAQWLFSVSLLPEVCRFLADVDRAATLYKLQRPYARHNVTLVPELARGSVSRGLGILATAMSRWDDAVRHFEDALEMNAEMGARPWLAHTRYDYGLMFRTRGEAGDRERARELLASAGALAQELGMSALTGKVLAVSRA